MGNLIPLGDSKRLSLSLCNRAQAVVCNELHNSLTEGRMFSEIELFTFFAHA